MTREAIILIKNLKELADQVGFEPNHPIKYFLVYNLPDD